MGGLGDPSTSVDGLISATVRAMAAGRGITNADVGESVGIARSTFERRMTRGGWTAAEAVRLAALFDITVDDLATGLHGQLVDQTD